MSIDLPPSRIDAGELLQHVSRVVYRDEPLCYGRDGTNRYDAPKRDYGVLYLGRNLPTALMESVFHKHQWDQDTKRSIALAEVHSRLVRAAGVLEDLCLADLMAEGVMAGYFGLNLEQLARRDYTYTQQVSARVHALQLLLPIIFNLAESPTGTQLLSGHISPAREHVFTFEF
ncbi:RES domain-containing protein [Pollutimonas bauzanensis]|uniref:RES domain-containing protein n=1 Tax=Pollutimonas bauzanensis TaxID=658167 RepID=A0A1M5Z5M1_9BURK|nr:RES domain-containing protein [Pollutimonas bauzanensis]